LPKAKDVTLQAQRSKMSRRATTKSHFLLLKTYPKSAIKDEKLHLTLIDTLTSERKEIVLDLFYSDNKF
jgi:hypothetical protein